MNLTRKEVEALAAHLSRGTSKNGFPCDYRSKKYRAHVRNACVAYFALSKLAIAVNRNKRGVVDLGDGDTASFNLGTR